MLAAQVPAPPLIGAPPAPVAPLPPGPLPVAHAPVQDPYNLYLQDIGRLRSYIFWFNDDLMIFDA